ncbi:MAG: XdhC family protein [Steroidobacteraceae bacterium]
MRTYSPSDLHSFFAQCRTRGESMVLATVVRTSGSTYRNVGAQMLIGQNGASAGLLSGGCLEGDLITRAKRVMRTQRAEMASYDSRSDDDVLWGMGLGCEGACEHALATGPSIQTRPQTPHPDRVRYRHHCRPP